MKKARKDAARGAGEHADPSDLAPDGAGSLAEAEPEEAPGPQGSAVVEPDEERIRRLTDELAQMKDQYLRLAADMDNFRKRAAKERAEIWNRAQADVVSNVLDSLTDLGRVAHLDPARTTSQDLLTGIELVERKLLKELEGAGLERVGVVGEPFDPNKHEAVATLPAQGPEQDHLVAAVFQPGYRFAGALLRPARVQVQIWSDNE